MINLITVLVRRDISFCLFAFFCFLIPTGVLSFLHELAHVVVGWIFSIKIIEFGLGSGPVLMRWRIRNVEYSLAPVPFGGFANALGEFRQCGQMASDEMPYSYCCKSPIPQCCYILAGVLMNMITGIGGLVALTYASNADIWRLAIDPIKNNPFWNILFGLRALTSDDFISVLICGTQFFGFMSLFVGILNFVAGGGSDGAEFRRILKGAAKDVSPSGHGKQRLVWLLLVLGGISVIGSAVWLGVNAFWAYFVALL